LSNDSHSFSYLITQKEENGSFKNYIHKVYSFSLKIKDDQKSSHYFQFNFKQLRVLFKISEDRDINNFFKKLVIKSNQHGEHKISIDWNFFKIVDDDYLKISKYLYQGEIPNNLGTRVDTM
jgi:hypothetical protein